MKYLLLIPCFVLIFCSCSSLTGKSSIDNDSSEILNLALHNAVGSDSAWRYHLRLPPPAPEDVRLLGEQDSSGYQRWKQWEDSIKAVLDTATFFVVVDTRYDSLMVSDKESIQAALTTPRTFRQIDSSFAEALHALCATSPKMDSFKLTALNSKYKYKLYPLQSHPKDNLRRLGSISFSKVGYNKERDRACIYTSFVCGGLCGYGQIHFLQKQKGKWVMINSWDMWVS